jgi:hypothetical protein
MPPQEIMGPSGRLRDSAPQGSFEDAGPEEGVDRARMRKHREFRQVKPSKRACEPCRKSEYTVGSWQRIWIRKYCSSPKEEIGRRSVAFLILTNSSADGAGSCKVTKAFDHSITSVDDVTGRYIQ